MYRHISLYTLSPNPENGKTQAENIRILQEMLNKVPEAEPSIVASSVGTGLGGPPSPPPGGPQFFHLAQIIDFETMEDCMSYPQSAAHGELVKFGIGVIQDVACIDFEI